MGGREYSVCDVVDVDGMRWTCTSARALDGTRMRTRMDGIPGGGGGRRHLSPLCRAIARARASLGGDTTLLSEFEVDLSCSRLSFSFFVFLFFCIHGGTSGQAHVHSQPPP